MSAKSIPAASAPATMLPDNAPPSILRLFRFAPACAIAALSLFVLRPPSAQAQHSLNALPAQSETVSTHTVKVKGATIPYKAIAGTLPVRDEHGAVTASLFYVYYERSDVKDRSKRPLMFSFNGGPGSASVWMHIGYTGPRFLAIDDEGYPIQPYGFTENGESILDVADIVYIDPVNTGFSRILDEKADRKSFFGVQADVAYLADWIASFISEYDRWDSPKYLIGESYGTTRVAGLAGQLQNNHWIYLNGVILVSPTDLGVERDGPVRDALYLPYYAATAWHHGVLDQDLQAMPLEAYLDEVEAFTVDQLVPSMVRGGTLSQDRRGELAEMMSRYSGLSRETLLQENLRVSTSLFWKELLREEGRTIGRLDSRYIGLDRKDGGERYDFDPALSSWNHAFTPAINLYLRRQLGVETSLQYWIFGPVHPWDRSGDRTGESLRMAMAQNPYLHVMVQSGYYDGGTDYFNAKYTMWQMDPSGRLEDRMRWKGYRSGHMMYLRQEDLVSSNQDIRDFISWSLEAAGASARTSRP